MIDEHARGEQVEHELDGMIRRRHDARVLEEGERPAEAIWAASERAYYARLGEERRLERLAYHEGQVARLSNTLGALVAHHRAEAERMRDAYARAVEAAQTDLGAYQTRHAGELRASLMRALQDKAQRLAGHAREAAQLYGQLEDSRYDLKNLTPPAAAQEYSGPPQRLTRVVMGVATNKPTGPDRGAVEGMLTHLAGLEAEFSEPESEAGAA